MRALLRSLKKRIAQWLLDVDELRLPRNVRIGDTVIITSAFIDLERLSSDPALAEGRLFYRSDLKQLRVSDGTSVYGFGQTIDMALLTSDPSRVDGRVWYRTDLKQLRVTDGSRVFAVVPVKVLRSGRYYGSFDAATAFTTLTLTANTLYATPFFVPEDTRFDRIAINVTSAVSGSKARVGVYRDDGNAYPSTLVPGTDVGELDTGTTGVKENAIDVTLPPGLYWLALVSSAGIAVRAVPVASLDSEILGLGPDLGTAPGVGYSVSYTYGALPSTFPTGASIVTSTLPLIAVRKA